jgi:cytochrome c oxidase cbb3-type subunit III
MTVAIVALGMLWMGLVFAQAGTTQGPPPPGQQPPPAGQRGAGPPAGGQGAGGQAGGGRRGGFTQYTRPLPSQDVIVRGKGLYETNCASCHATDLRGGDKGTNLLRSGTLNNDKDGQLLAAAVKQHEPPFNFIMDDVLAMEGYLHSILATMGGQGSPPGRNPTAVELNVLVGDAAGGAKVFDSLCSKCHSISGDLKGIGGRFPDARALQNAWVGGSSGRFGGGGGGRGGGGGNVATVTMADGSKVEGALIRKTDWLVVLLMADGTRKTIARNPDTGLPKVDVKDPQEGHKKMVLELDDATNKKMYDITAYLWSLK